MKIFIIPLSTGDRWEMAEGYVLSIAKTKEEAIANVIKDNEGLEHLIYAPEIETMTKRTHLVSMPYEM